LKLLQYLLDILDVFFLCVGEDENVIKVHNEKVVLVGVKDVVHEMLKASRSIGEPKCHD
jgi:hypothetical protein